MKVVSSHRTPRPLRVAAIKEIGFYRRESKINVWRFERASDLQSFLTGKSSESELQSSELPTFWMINCLRSKKVLKRAKKLATNRELELLC